MHVKNLAWFWPLVDLHYILAHLSWSLKWRDLPKVPQEASGRVGLTANSEIRHFSYNLIPLSSSGLGVGGRAWGAGPVFRSSVLCPLPCPRTHHPDCFVPGTPGVHQGCSQIVYLVRSWAQGSSHYPRHQVTRHQVVQIPQTTQCPTPAKLFMDAAGILAQVGAGSNLFCLSLLWVGLSTALEPRGGLLPVLWAPGKGRGDSHYINEVSEAQRG